MNEPVVFGTFEKKGGLVHRTSAYIQWGKSETSIGSCLLLNPGSATPIGTKGSLDELLDKNTVWSGQIKDDPTIRQLVTLVRRIHGETVEGRMYIYNLFTIRHTRSEEAIGLFERLVDEREYSITESIASVAELRKHPWILLGWGVNNNSTWRNLGHVKKLWLKRIEEAGPQLVSFGKKHLDREDYYHPCPLIATHRSGIIDELLEIFWRRF